MAQDIDKEKIILEISKAVSNSIKGSKSVHTVLQSINKLGYEVVLCMDIEVNLHKNPAESLKNFYPATDQRSGKKSRFFIDQNYLQFRN